MPTQLVPDTVMVEIRGTLLGQQVENTFYYRYISPPDESELLTLVNDIGDVVEEAMLEYLPAGFTAREVYAKDLSAPITVQATNASIAGMVGTYPGDTLPSYVTFAIARRSGLTGRSSRGRIYWMGMSEANVSNNVVGTDDANAMVDILDLIDAAAVADGFTPVVVSRYTAGALRPTGVTYPVSVWAWNDLDVDTRRSRKKGKGS